MSTRLSKSRYQKGLQCEKALWLAAHAPDLADPVPESRQWIFDQGSEVGRLAQGLFPGGIEITEDHAHTDAALRTTASLLATGASVLFEPAFFFDDVLVRVDALVSAGDGSWDLYEVKSSTRLKPEHVTDAAVQTYVVEGSGLSVRSAFIVHLDSSYVWEGGAYDLERLFASEDVTAKVRGVLPDVPGTVERFHRMLAGPEPRMLVGRACSSPYVCDYRGYCHDFLPKQHPVTALPRIKEQVLRELLEAGITDIRDIPEACSGLSPAQRRVVACVKRGEPHLDTQGLAGDLDALVWPVYHLDFETVNPALPLWPGTHPYQVVPFQYSIHVHHEDGTTEHREYLHEGTDDPRRPLAERLIADLREHGSVLHYATFERTRIDELARALPDLADPLLAVRDRLVDLERIVGRRTEHPAANGRTSIKHVLPAWCSERSYEGLAIAEGLSASTRYLRYLRGELERSDAATLRADLLAYCGLDTRAMVALLEEFRKRVRDV